MSSLLTTSWTAPANTKIPAETHAGSFRVTINAAGSQTINLLAVPASSNRFICTKVVFRGFSTTLAALTATLGVTGSTSSLVSTNTTFQTATTTGVYSYAAKAGGTVCVPGDQMILTTGTGPAAASSGVIDVFGYFEQGV
jgi:hypothetical protein